MTGCGTSLANKKRRIGNRSSTPGVCEPGNVEAQRWYLIQIQRWIPGERYSLKSPGLRACLQTTAPGMGAANRLWARIRASASWNVCTAYLRRRDSSLRMCWLDIPTAGFFTNLFARTYPDEVAGVVFVDASHPDQQDWWHTHRPLESLLVNEMAKATYNWEFFDFERVAEDIRAGRTVSGRSRYRDYGGAKMDSGHPGLARSVAAVPAGSGRTSRRGGRSSRPKAAMSSRTSSQRS